MTYFRDLPIHERRKQLGSMSEEMFDIYAKEKGNGSIKFGFHDEIKEFWKIPLFVRKTPDRVFIRSNEALFVEIKGCGREGIIKIKLEDLESLDTWNKFLPVYFAFTNFYTKEVGMASLQTIQKIAPTKRIEEFPDNHKKYYVFLVNDFSSWYKLPDSNDLRKLFDKNRYYRY